MNKVTLTLPLASILLFCTSHILAATYPTQINQRPLTLPGGSVQVDTNVEITQGFDAIRFGLIGALGYNDNIQIALTKSMIKPGLGFGIAYSVLNKGMFDWAPSFTLEFIDGESSNTVDSINFGLRSRLNVLNKKLAINLGHDFFHYSLSDSHYLLRLPINIDYQFTPKINIRVDTQAVSLTNNSGTFLATTIVTKTPIGLTGQFSLSKIMDASVRFGVPDAQADTIGFEISLLFSWRAFL